MIITIKRVRIVRVGFAVVYHEQAAPHDLRATVLRPALMPAGHELLRSGATVDARMDGDRIVAVRQVRRRWH